MTIPLTIIPLAERAARDGLIEAAGRPADGISDEGIYWERRSDWTHPTPHVRIVRLTMQWAEHHGRWFHRKWCMNPVDGHDGWPTGFLGVGQSFSLDEARNRVADFTRRGA